jgi:uncharacterized SAM-binding protein YcdF (DUF218 family)/glycosyltransferase involved in cell wall biosynthesis
LLKKDKAMLKNENIICISSIDWDFIWQGHQEIMSMLARNGNKVLFIENTGVRAPGIRDIPRLKKRIKNWFKGVKGIRREIDNLYVFSPLVLPFPYFRIARWINLHLILPILDKWMKAMGFSNPVVWTFLPTPLSLDIINNLVEKVLIYYCIDDFGTSSLSARKIKPYEEKLIKQANLVFVTSDTLYRKCALNTRRVFKFPFAVNMTKFEKAMSRDSEAPKDIRDIKRPVIGFAGGVRKLVDKNLMKFLAKSRQDYSFVFIGPLQTDVKELAEIDNIHFLGQKEHSDLPKYINNFDVAIIPYLLTDFTKSTYPAKLSEYLVMGKPVVSTDLREIMAFNKQYDNIIYIGETKERFAECIEKALNEDNEKMRKRRLEVAGGNSWENHIERMSSLIEAEVKRKKLDREAKWKENLLNFYRTARKRLTRVALICFLSYLFFFRTPFIWFIAAPLKIVNEPQKADTIVVFGGGVGETGGPGKSTIERARHAVKLYKQGYAEKIVFSSGYIFHYNDAENMKLFALSMGVPSKNIILEQKADSTYENAVFTKEIIDGYNWDSILLVSSPYNMRRASLVFKKLDKDLRIICAPVMESQFYYRWKKVRLEQIKAIGHEYLGVLYYWWKGWI